MASTNLDVPGNFGLELASDETLAESSFTTQWRTPASRLSKYKTSWSLVSLTRREDPFADLKQLFQILLDSRVPGPRLLRMRTEFNKPVGLGGQAHVYAASQSCEESLLLCSQHSDPYVKESARSWTRCVIKQLRNDPTRDLNFQVSSALSEIKHLCQRSLREHPNIVKLSGWGLCLDTLEAPLTVPRLPFLILEKALCDLSIFLRSPEAHDLAYEDLCHIALGIGRGLGAIHDANIAHGDLKPDNILVFDNRTERTQRPAAAQDFVAKVCDFGSASEVTDGVDVKHYSGTPYWRPPEYYDASPPVSLQRCDIFTYGLTVWALFLRDPCSPILDIESKGPCFVQEARGQQHYFAAASESIQMRYGSIDDHASESRQTYNSPAQSVPFALLLPRSAITRSYSKQASRVLAVLASALDDNPSQRDPRAWRYLNLQAHPDIPGVRVPTKYTQQATKHNNSYSSFLPFRTESCFGRPGKHSQGTSTQATSLLRLVGLTTWRQLKIWIPALRPGSSRQRAYEQYHAVFSDLLGPDPSEKTVLDHEDNTECFDINHARLNELRAITSSLYTWPQFIRFYCAARMRSRFNQCCWKAIHRHLTVDHFEDLCDLFLSPRGASTGFPGLSGLTLDIMAWVFRGDQGREALLNPASFPMVRYRMIKREDFDELNTMWILLLFESGFDIGSKCSVEPGKPPCSAFRYYLSKLSNDTLAVQICQHFHRISSLDGTTPEARHYLSGTSYTYGDDIAEPQQSSPEKTGSNTALHDAVATANYSVVEYLVRTNFVVTALDEEGRSPIDLALALSNIDATSGGFQKTPEGFQYTTANPRSVWPDSRRADYKLREILALLQQHPSNTKVKSTLPLGWDRIETIQHTLYMESSIDSPIMSVTFQKPKAGLFEDRKLALAERQFQGRGQTYILNPLRFLRTSSDRDLQRIQPAKEPYFSDSWYEEEIIRTSLPPLDPFLDERGWYRTTAKVLYYSWTSIGSLLSLNMGYTLLMFVPLWLAGKFLLWNQSLQLIFGLLSLGPLLSALHLCNHLLIRSIAASSVFKFFPPMLLTYAPHFMISVLALQDRNSELCQAIIIGAVMNDCLLALGGTMIVSGAYSHEVEHNSTTSSTFASLAQIGPTFSILLYFFPVTGIASPSTDVSAGILTISSAISVVSIILYLMYLGFRYTHEDLFDSEYADRIDEDAISTEGHGSSARRFLGSTFAILLILVLLIFVTESVYRAVEVRFSSFQTIFGLLIAPLAIKIWLWLEILQRARSPYTFDAVIEETAGASIHMSLLIGPALVLLGQAQNVPTTLRFGLLETLTYGLTSMLLTSVLTQGRSNYMKGILLVWTYLLVASANVLNLK